MTDPVWISTAVLKPGDQGGETLLDTVTLDREARYRRRIRMITDAGRPFLLDLPEATYLADGDALVVSDGLIGVRAAVEPLMEVTAGDAITLSRIAWHIGNRHTPAEIAAGAIYIQQDHVLKQMIEGLGGNATDVMRAFEPEGGAYGGRGSLGGGHGHSHSDGHNHSHRHGHDSGGSHSHAADVTLYRKSRG